MDFYLLALIVLLVIAVLDLSVGVANDAVNFLNSAVGSRAAGLRSLTVLAALGLICGSLLSSGMMEVARSGIFQPAAFSFHDVMIIFVAVMVADVLLLDAFNTLGLPTSTTVSVIFELLGAAFLVAFLKLVQLDQGFAALAGYLNAGNALRIIGGIFLSIAVAFVLGAAVQWFTRLLFTFRPGQQGRWLHASWAALALSVIGWFLLVKAVAQSGLLPQSAWAWVQTHPLAGFLALALASFAAAETGWRLWRIEPTRLVVLVGTLALATAFASNDLVNFLGVPLAGLTAYADWVDSGVPATERMMAVLAEPVRGQTWLMLCGGVIMALTLWLSSKARSVTETEVSLGRQGHGSERFRPGPFSRMVLKLALLVHGVLNPLVPELLRRRIERRFRIPKPATERASDGDAPAFDLIRGSVNLTVASSLIALATIWKLPLSTTFVSFMVAMGTSLADRSWGRDSAVYRIAGVSSVVAGWFLTALIAFITAALFALVLWSLHTLGLLILLLLVGAVLVLSARWHRSRLPAELAGGADRERYGRLYAMMAEILADSCDARESLLTQNLARCQARRRDQLDALNAAQALPPVQASALVRLLRLEASLMALLERIQRRLLEHRRNLLPPLTALQHDALVSCLTACSQSLRSKAHILSGQEDLVLPLCAARQVLGQSRLAELDRVRRSGRLDEAGGTPATLAEDGVAVPGSAHASGSSGTTRLLLQLTDDLQDLIELADESLLLIERAGLACTSPEAGGVQEPLPPRPAEAAVAVNAAAATLLTSPGQQPG
jgi:phosphate/sulfate permease